MPGRPCSDFEQFKFTAAVVCSQTAADTVTAALQANGVPFLVYGLPVTGAPATAGASVVADMDQVVPMLEALLSA